MNFFKRRKFLRQANYLEMIPIRKVNHELTNSPDKQEIPKTQETAINNQLITLLIPKFDNESLRFFLIPKYRSKYMKIKLDAEGSATWMLIDGERNVEQICNLLFEQSDKQISETVDRVTKFLTTLYDNRYITYKQLQDKS